jgi:serine/threonine-protein kinase
VSDALSPSDDRRSVRARQVRDLFEAVLDLEAAPRAAMLEARCAGDPELRAEVEELLAALERARTADLIPAILRPGQTDGGPGGGFTGLQIGNYRLEAEIGHGGMGAVYRARHLLLDRVAAVKILHPHLSGDESMVQRFLNEARAVNDIRHPRIVEVLDAGRLASGTPYIVMEHLDGQSLAARLRETGRLPPAVAVRTARQIAGALAAAHARGIVHRDLKPENVFLCDGGSDGAPRAKVLDFGIAKLRADLAGAGAETRPTGGLLGTPQYMAPEQWRTGAVADPRIDVYALGLILFEMLSGTPPFLGDSWVDLLHLHLSAAPPRMRDRGVDVPAALEAVVRRALAKEIGERLPSMAAFDEELSAFDVAPSGTAHADASARSPGGSLRASGRRKVAAIVIGGVTVTMALLGARLGLRRSADDRTAVEAAMPPHHQPAAAPPPAAPASAPRAPAAPSPSAPPVAAAPSARPPAPSSQKPATTRARRSAPAAADQAKPAADDARVPAFLRQNPYR